MLQPSPWELYYPKRTKMVKNKKDVQIVLGILGYQRPQIRGFAKIAKPLVELTKKKENDKFE